MQLILNDYRTYSCKLCLFDMILSYDECRDNSQGRLGLMLCCGYSGRPSRGSNSGGDPAPAGRNSGKGLRHFSMKVCSTASTATLISSTSILPAKRRLPAKFVSAFSAAFQSHQVTCNIILMQNLVTQQSQTKAATLHYRLQLLAAYLISLCTHVCIHSVSVGSACLRAAVITTGVSAQQSSCMCIDANMAACHIICWLL